MGVFSKIREGLQKTRDAMMQKMQRVINSFTKIDEELFEQLEETMIMSDMGVETSVEICDRLRKLVKERGVKDPAQIMGLIEEIIGDMMGNDVELNLSTKPSVIMVIGVNGAGKTTTIGKLCHQFKENGKKVLVAAADTFRAAAIDQLEVWTKRAGVDIVKHSEGSDPGSVVYDAVSAAIARECDIVIIDTAGRLHNKKNLMLELEKINRILNQRAEGCAIETLLVLDATTGQNAVSQARLFSEVANITGIVLTKLDGTAKGGIVVSIKNELGIPVKLIGVGEKIDDLQTFDNSDFVRALFDHSEDVNLEGETEEAAEVDSEQEEAEAAEEIVTEESETAETEEETASEPEQEQHRKKKWWQFGKEEDLPEETPEPVEETQEEAADVTEVTEETIPAEEIITEPEETAEPEEDTDSEPEPEESVPESETEQPKKKKWWQFGKKEEEHEELQSEEAEESAEAAQEEVTEVTEETVPADDDVTEPEEAAEEEAEEDAPEQPKKKKWWQFGKKKED